MVMLSLLAAAPKGPLDTWSPTLLAQFALLLPLAAVLVIAAFTIDSRRVSAAISIIFTLASLVCALLVAAIEVAHPLHLERPATFLQFFTGQSGAASEFTLQWGVLADPLAATVALAVVLVSLLVQVSALSFMRREDGVVRFFCVLLFATFAMLGVTLSISYFEMLLFFGMVTVSTYLLIAHWWQREEATSAATRAFIISALGDLALLAAVAYIYFRFSELNFQALAGQYTGGRVSSNGLFIMAILVFIAAAAKSAVSVCPALDADFQFANSGIRASARTGVARAQLRRLGRSSVSLPTRAFSEPIAAAIVSQTKTRPSAVHTLHAEKLHR